MRRRNLLILSLVACSVMGMSAYITFTYDPDAPKSEWPVLQAGENSKQQADVIVGPNVQISPTDDTVNYWECVIAADSNHPKRLVSAVMQRKSNRETDIVVFYSEDGGTTWRQGCHQVCPGGHGFYDPTIAFGPNGTAFLAYMDVNDDASSDKENVGALVFLASPDGGKSWEQREVFPKYVDRPWLAIDNSSGENRGRVYCIGQVERRSVDGQITHAEPIIFHSSDDLRSLSTPSFPHGGRQMVSCRPVNPVIFSDGTLFLAYQDRYLKRRIHTWPRPAIYTLKSTNGGRSFEQTTDVNTKWWHDSITSSELSPVGAEFPSLAVDLNSRLYAGHLYCVWSDGSGDDGYRIFFSSSPDLGNTWSPAVVLSEQPMIAGTEKGYVSFVPNIAVNKDGVVAVSWYDRRGLPKTRREPAVHPDAPVGAFNLIRDGWNYRVRVSLDGGGSWLPSVQVNELPGRGGVFVGHSAGLVADVKGRFHAAWIDNRIGKNKLWTASIEVDTEE